MRFGIACTSLLFMTVQAAAVEKPNCRIAFSLVDNASQKRIEEIIGSSYVTLTPRDFEGIILHFQSCYERISGSPEYQGQVYLGSERAKKATIDKIIQSLSQGFERSRSDARARGNQILAAANLNDAVNAYQKILDELHGMRVVESEVPRFKEILKLQEEFSLSLPYSIKEQLSAFDRAFQTISQDLRRRFREVEKEAESNRQAEAKGELLLDALDKTAAEIKSLGLNTGDLDAAIILTIDIQPERWLSLRQWLALLLYKGNNKITASQAGLDDTDLFSLRVEIKQPNNPQQTFFLKREDADIFVVGYKVLGQGGMAQTPADRRALSAMVLQAAEVAFSK